MKQFNSAISSFLKDRSRLPHALLVRASSSGFGERAFAELIAKAVLCESPTPGGTACGTCASCAWFGQGNHPDFRLIVPEDDVADEEGAEPATAKKSKRILIEQVRGVAEFFAVSTHRGGHKVVVLHPAEQMQPQAANALLKTLEEPPGRALIILATAHAARLLPTIRSRCRVLPVPRLTQDEAVAWLSEQGVNANEAASCLALAGGAPWLALDLAKSGRAAEYEAVFDQLAKGASMDPLVASAALDRQPLESTLAAAQIWVSEQIAVLLNASLRFLTDRRTTLTASSKNANVDALFACYRKLCEARRLQSHPLNARLVLENLLVSYRLCYR